jgi:hypothetical protein
MKHQKNSTNPSLALSYEEVRQDTPVEEPDPSKPGDGFTEEEVASALDPLNRKWDPDKEYEEQSIDQVIPGPRAITFVGRIVVCSMSPLVWHISRQSSF